MYCYFKRTIDGVDTKISYPEFKAVIYHDVLDSWKETETIAKGVISELRRCARLRGETSWGPAYGEKLIVKYFNK